LAVEILSEDLKHIHNDYIRIFLDYGIAGSIFWLAVLSRLASLSKLGFCLALYQLIVFSTDNTFVYYPHLVTLYLFAKLYDHPERACLTARRQAPPVVHLVPAV
jgi:O-antigen ligase